MACTSTSHESLLPPFLERICCFPPPSPPTCANIRSHRDNHEILEKFCYSREIGQGRLEIHHVKDEELEAAALLLAEPYSTAKQWKADIIPMAAFMVKRYMAERRVQIPHLAILVGFYREKDGVEEELACTAEISFDAIGAHPAPGTPRPPNEYPYIGNVAVQKSLRRKGIGSELIKACEELIIQMKAERKVYLHCNTTATGPFKLYTNAGYKVVKKDNILVWLCFKPPRYLMSKELPDANRSDASNCNYHPI